MLLRSSISSLVIITSTLLITPSCVLAEESGTPSSESLSESEQPQCQTSVGPSCQSESESRHRLQEEEAEENNNECSLYLAPSSVPGAGWGVYTAIDLKEGDTVGENDMYIQIKDRYKTLPFKGQQRFLSWLSYVWPQKRAYFYLSTTDAFPSLPDSSFSVDEGLSNADRLLFYDEYKDDEFMPISAFAPGIASQVNSHPHWHNLRESNESQVKDSSPPHRHASTPFHNVEFQASKDVSAGSELFLFYGEKYHQQLKAKTESKKGYDTLGDYMENYDFSHLPREEDKRALLDATTRWRSLFVKKSGGILWKGNATDSNSSEPVGMASDNTTTDQEPPVQQKIQWLKENGVCMDKLSVQTSKIPDAGKGAFAKRSIAAGEIVAPAPLLALKRDDLRVYERTGIETYRDFLNLDRVIDTELLINYCYSHPDSEVLLIPYSPIVSYINHGSRAPNVEIRWSSGAQEWLDMHPIDVLGRSGKLRMEFVALREISPGEEITIDYGAAWAGAWENFDDEDAYSFRHEIGVPEGFFPDNWLNTSVVYEMANPGPLKPGEIQQLVFKHNGKPVAKNAYRVGLAENFSKKMLEYSEDIGIIKEYEKLLFRNGIPTSGDWYVFDTPEDGEWFAQKYNNNAWKFNMHYVAAWDNDARLSFLQACDDAGFHVAIDAIGRKFGLDNMTCFHASFMGVSECDNSFTHTDVYATDEKAFNLIWPVIVVNGSKPELDVQSDDANVVISINYEYDTAIIMGDYGYHKTSPINYKEAGIMRVVVGMYCGQMDDSNREMLANIYDGEAPAPFMDQFEHPMESHWESVQ